MSRCAKCWGQDFPCDECSGKTALPPVRSEPLLADLRSRLWARCENAYSDMISVARRDESLGWEIKVERGEFGRKELDSHAKMGELLGRHRALAEACREIDEVLKANATREGSAAARTLHADVRGEVSDG